VRPTPGAGTRPPFLNTKDEKNTMMKKTGIIVGASAALLLAVSPLAFAHDSAPASPQCEFSAVGENSAEQAGVGGTGLLAGGAVSNLTGAQANTQAQAPTASCNNIEDVLDLNLEDNVQDNSTTEETVTESIEDSFNTEN
jgi:hypothetical protein